MSFPKRKLKLNFDIGKPNPDPPPFICALCGEERGYWTIIHNGKEKICALHYQVSPIIKRNLQINYDDRLQINAAEAAIREIEKCKKK